MSAEQLIQYHSEEMIQEDENLTGQKYLLFQPTLSSEGEQAQEKHERDQDFFKIDEENQNSTHQSYPEEIAPEEVQPRLRLRRTKADPRRSYEERSEGQQDDESSEEERSNRKGLQKTRQIKKEGEEKKKGYATKNFLATYKTPHLEKLELHFGKDIYRLYPRLSQIKEKNGISMQDYEYLYNIHEFKEIWEQMFETRHLYRAHLISRCKTEARLTYVRKIWVFQKAFLEGKFDHIN